MMYMDDAIRGTIELMDAPAGVLRWRRSATLRADDPVESPTVVEIAVNFTDREVPDAVSAGRVIGGTSVDHELSASNPCGLGPDEARIVVVT